MIAPPDARSARTAFLTTLRRSELLPDAEFVRAAARLPAAATAGQAAQQFVRDGLLTRYQADRLLAGKADGFHLGQYLILEPLGRGRAGRTFKARHRSMNRLVAVEVLPPNPARPADRAEVLREARSAARLAHPHVVTVLDADEAGGRLYVVLEYVDGATLDAVVRAGGPVPVARACEFARQAALGLAHAHEKGLAHGGLTPAGLLVGRPGGVGPAGRPTVKVLNLGLTRLALYAPAAGDLHGAADAVEYLAPEQLDGDGWTDHRSDLYALGCVLYFLLAGRPPRPAADGGPLLHQLAEPVPVEALRPDVPPAVAGVVAALMAKDPAARPAAADAAARLAPFGEADGGGRLDFALPAGDPPDVGGYLSGLVPSAPGREDSPFADLGDDPAGRPTLDPAGATTAATRVPGRAAGPWAAARVLALAAGIIAAVVGAVALVLRSAPR